MKILIVGAGFVNKGAQSMLFITADEIKKRFPDCEVFFTTPESLDMSDYRIKNVYYTPVTQALALEGKGYFFKFAKLLCKDCVKFLIGRRENVFKFNEFRKVVDTVDMIIDVSGFNLGEKWDILSQQMYLNNIRIAKRRNIPMYIMPQSFGGFSYSEEKKFLLKDIKKLLPYPKIVFAREKQGKELLESVFRLKNVRLSSDLVLQNTGIEYRHIFRKEPKLNISKITTEKNTAIIPNRQCFAHGNAKSILGLYCKMIDKLLEGGYHVYLFRHSYEDFEICKKLKAKYPAEDRVHLIENDFSCIEYDKFVQNFDFVICSRFHGVVHAYRNCVPCIVLGWEIKYQELTQLLGQSHYCFDITANDLDSEGIINSLKQISSSYKEEKEKIRNKLQTVQENNCFDMIAWNEISSNTER